MGRPQGNFAGTDNDNRRSFLYIPAAPDPFTLERQMSATSVPPLWRQIPRLALLAIGLMVVLVGLHILYMVIYGHLINPGQPAEHYPAHALASGPWFSTIAGTALFFYAGRRLARRARGNGVAEALVMCTIYLIIELAFQLGAGSSFQWIFVLAILTKYLAAGAGAATSAHPSSQAPAVSG
jgi:hypothetical protein